MTQHERMQLTRKCDELFSKVVRLKGCCEECGSTEYLQCAHGFSRRYRALRWDEVNAFCLCRACHVYFTHRPIEWEVWLRGRWGDEAYNRLAVVALAGRKWMLDELVALRDGLSARLKGGSVSNRSAGMGPVVLSQVQAKCPECGHTVGQISATREHAIQVVTEAMEKHIEQEHAP